MALRRMTTLAVALALVSALASCAAPSRKRTHTQVGVHVAAIEAERTFPTPSAAAVAERTVASSSASRVRPPFAAPAGSPSPASAVAVQPTTRLLYLSPRPGARVAYGVVAHNPWGQPISFLVIGRAIDTTGATWLDVLTGVRPNGADGWVPASEVTAEAIHDRILVDLSSHRLWHWRDGRLLQSFTVAVGSPFTPSTTGRSFVWASIPSNADGEYGAYVLGLSGFSRVLTYWPGHGRMAIHGTANPADPGLDVSHGCVRVYNPQMLQLRDVPLGTPVLIRP
jgi:lipoprotein-anchoring transpeptidase ErfK/SrfK